jgi:hypothetical protein
MKSYAGMHDREKAVEVEGVEENQVECSHEVIDHLFCSSREAEMRIYCRDSAPSSKAQLYTLKKSRYVEEGYAQTLL